MAACLQVRKKAQKFLRFIALFPKQEKKVFATGLHALSHILGTARNCCCTADVYHAS